MKNYSVAIKGKTPLLMHFDNIEAQDEMNAEGATGGKAGDDRSPPDRWKTYLYVSSEFIVVPADNIMSALGWAGPKISIGGRQTLKLHSQDLFFDTPELDFLCGPKLQPVKRSSIEHVKGSFKEQRAAVTDLGFDLFVKRAKIQQSRHIRVRPRFDNWEIRGTFSTDNPELTLERLTRLFEVAGNAGLCDWRPSSPKKPGPWGRFTTEVKLLG